MLPNRKDFWCLTTFFNPAGYKSRLRNHQIYCDHMKNHNLVVVEMAFGDEPFVLSDAIHLRGNSILWPKERMMNVALSMLPPECKYIAWIDGDVLIYDDWIDMAVKKFENGADILQLFDQVKHLPPGHDHYSGQDILTERGLVHQAKNYPDFISLRKQNKLLYATTGFAWAAKRELFKNGFYDKHILGANDNIIIDSCLNTFELHHYYKTSQGTPILEDMMEWSAKFGKHKADYLPITIYHLYHGEKKDRGYLTREDILKKHHYDPKTDIVLKNNVYEWNSNKPDLHLDVKNYFYSRKEDILK